MFSHLATPSSYSEKLKIFHIRSEQSLWDQTDPSSCLTSGKSLESSMPRFLLIGKACLVIDVFHRLQWEGNAKMHLKARESTWLISNYSINVIKVTVIITIDITESSCQPFGLK